MYKKSLHNMEIVELVISDNEDGQEAIALVDRPAIQRNFVAFSESAKYEFKIENEDQRIVSGALLLADTPIYRKDGDREFYVMFSKDTIKKIAIKYFKEGKHNNVNEMHNPKKALNNITLFESWINDKERGIMPMQGFEDVPDGSWFGSMKIDDDVTWAKVKEGKFQGFSIEGYFSNKTAEVKAISDEDLVNEIVNILENE